MAKGIGVIEFYKDRVGNHRWRLKAPNGQVICVPGGCFTSKSAAVKNYSKVRWYFQGGLEFKNK